MEKAIDMGPGARFRTNHDIVITEMIQVKPPGFHKLNQPIKMQMNSVYNHLQLPCPLLIRDTVKTRLFKKIMKCYSYFIETFIGYLRLYHCFLFRKVFCPLDAP